MITCTPASAVITHRNVVTTKNGDKENTFWTRSVHSLEKRGGKWQVVCNAGNGMDEYAMLGYLEMDWNNADVNRDADWFEKNFAADYSSISSRDAKIYTKADDIANFKTHKGRTEWNKLSEMDIRIEGNMTVVTGVNHVKGRDDKNQPFDLRVRFTDTFIKRDGRWQVWATQGTRIP
jgi:ketosteroid isomerase-like protein